MTKPYNARRLIYSTRPDWLTVQIEGRAAYMNVECSAAALLTEEDQDALARAISREIQGAYEQGFDDGRDAAINEHYRAQAQDMDPDFDGIEPRILGVDEEGSTP